MNILYLCTFYHRAMIFRDSMNMLEKEGNSTLAFNAVAKGTIVDDKYLSIMDDKVVHEECYKSSDRYLYFRKQKKIYNRVIDEINISEFDVIHSHTFFNGGWVAQKIKNKMGIPFVVTVRNTDLNAFLKIPFFIPIAKKIVNEAGAIMFLSKAYRTQFLNKLYNRKSEKCKEIMSKCFVIPNGLEEFWLENKAKPKLQNNDIIQLLCVGKIDYNKNMNAIISAMKVLKEKGIDTRLTVVGQVVSDDVFRLLEKDKNVNLIPYQTKENLIDYYRSSDIFVLPSFTETFGRVYAEAMTQGLPVVYTQNQGFDGLFEDGKVGFRIDPNSPESIANAIIRIKDNYTVMSANCVECSSDFDWSLIVKKLERMYEKLLEK